MFADVAFRHPFCIGFGDLDVIAEDLVVTNFEAAYFSALALVRFEIRDPIARSSRSLEHGIQLIRVALLKHPDLVERGGRVIHQSGFQLVQHLAAKVDPVSELTELLTVQSLLEIRDRFQRLPQRVQIPWGGDTGRGSVGNPLKIRQSLEFTLQLGS